MLAVAKLAGNTSVSPWVIYCAVACIGIGIGVGTEAGKDAIAEVSEAINGRSSWPITADGKGGGTRTAYGYGVGADDRNASFAWRYFVGAGIACLPLFFQASIRWLVDSVINSLTNINISTG